ncbi:hypothetical protein [Lactobacillus johnsonii]|uniref:hypothetical protein n=1 Tax=Lactobacillus johnsonii TaxID=33959 RepID=UPI001781688C|nr:hypothetical protein [Lactobacillus johnsonii]QXL48556.1 hypothetical protein IGB12_09845 [Lactobacillus johnsonii]
MKKFDKKIALYQGIERKYFNSTVKLPAALLLTTEAVVADKPEPVAPQAPAMDPSMMGGMM